MKLLLDTHTFIWWDSAPDQLSPAALAAFRAPENTLLLSVVSLWEIQVKRQIGKLQLHLPLAEIIENQQTRNQIQILPVLLPHVLEVENLPLHHKDPFDRLLIAQALVEQATLLSKDGEFLKYPVPLLW